MMQLMKFWTQFLMKTLLLVGNFKLTFVNNKKSTGINHLFPIYIPNNITVELSDVEYTHGKHSTWAVFFIASSSNDDFHPEDLVLASANNSMLALKSYQHQLVETSIQRITIDRQSPNFLRDIIRIYKRPGFDLKSVPDIEFLNEIGVDGGGLTREFFHLILTKLRDGDPGSITLFEGEADHLVSIHCASSLDSGLFHLFGKVLAHSILHEGMGFIGMAPAVAKYIATRSTDEAAALVCLNDIPDLEYRDYAKKVKFSNDFCTVHMYFFQFMQL